MTTHRIKLISNLLFACAQLWSIALALRMGASLIAAFSHAYKDSFAWLYYIPCVWPEYRHGGWFNYWPMLLLFTLVTLGLAAQKVAEMKKERAQKQYRNEAY